MIAIMVVGLAPAVSGTRLGPRPRRGREAEAEPPYWFRCRSVRHSSSA